MTSTDERLNSYFEKLVPASGKADTVAGEIVRALSKIGYRYFNDGDMIGVDEGNETCNAPARYLAEKCPENVVALISKMWGAYKFDDKQYEKSLYELVNTTLDWLDTTDLASKGNDDDMLDWKEPEDDDWYEDDDEYDDWLSEDEYDDEDDDDEY